MVSMTALFTAHTAFPYYLLSRKDMLSSAHQVKAAILALRTRVKGKLSHKNIRLSLNGSTTWWFYSSS